jgi:hypothetical protein
MNSLAPWILGLPLFAVRPWMFWDIANNDRPRGCPKLTRSAMFSFLNVFGVA